MHGAVQPLREVAQNANAAINQIGAASQRLETVQTGSRDLAYAMEASAQRFENLDRDLARVVDSLQNGLQGFAREVSRLVSTTNEDMAKAVTQLQSAIVELSESLEDRRGRPPVRGAAQ
jgi:uncharacterized protein YukE